MPTIPYTEAQAMSDNSSFVITFVDQRTGELRTVKSEDVPAKIRKHLISTINLVESFEEDIRPQVNISSGGLTEEDAAKINMYDALVEAGVQEWEGWPLAAERYDEMTSDEEPASAEAA